MSKYRHDARNIAVAHDELLKKCPQYKIALAEGLRIYEKDPDKAAKAYNVIYKHADNCELCTTLWVAARMEKT